MEGRAIKIQVSCKQT